MSKPARKIQTDHRKKRLKSVYRERQRMQRIKEDRDRNREEVRIQVEEQMRS